MKKSILSIKDATVSAAQIASCLYHHPIINRFSELSLKQCIDMAKKAIAGESLKFEEVVSENEIFTVKIIEELSEEEIEDNAWNIEQKKYWDLLEEGKNGNAEAAIEFCKAVAESKVNFSAYA